MAQVSAGSGPARLAPTPSRGLRVRSPASSTRLFFTPSAGSGTTIFTLTDTSTAGTSTSDATTTVAVLSGGTLDVLVAQFLADQSTLDQTVGGFDIFDIAANITANLGQLNDPNIDVITISDNGQVAPSVQQLTSDATAIGKLLNANLSSALLAISDNAGNIEAGLSTLVADTGKIASRSEEHTSE